MQPNPYDRKATMFYCCGCCEQYHNIEFKGDCRQDDQRFNPEDLDEKFGELGWAEVEQPELFEGEYTMDPVIFRKWKDNGGILALFPAEPADYQGRLCNSYEHVGQHGGADYLVCIGRTLPATPAEYADLKAELESIGYDLKVCKRRSPQHRAMFRRELRAQR